MQAIVSLLDDHHYQLTEALWRELEAQFGLRGVYATPYPHFSYHVARGYDRESLKAGLQHAAENTPPFQIVTAGLGVFTGLSPVLHIPIVRTSALTEFHQTLWRAVAGCVSGAVGLYNSENWLPHITIGSGDIPKDLLAEAVRLLGGRNYSWTIRIDNLALIEEDPQQGQRLGFRLDLEGHANDGAGIPAPFRLR